MFIKTWGYLLKTIVFLFFIIFSPLFFCFGLDDIPENTFVFIGREKISLRYSTRNDVEKILGNPEKADFFERGGEGFYWRNFTVCSYDNDRLIINYDQYGAVIRIIINVEYSGVVQFLSKNVKNLIRVDILDMLKNLGMENDYIGTGGAIFFEYKLTSNIQIDYGFWFYGTEKDWYTDKARWIDMYYPWSW